MKKIIFFDGDGTIWYPKRTKHEKNPIWLYRDKRFKNHINHIMVTPTTINTLRKLKKLGIINVILSTHPHPPKEAEVIINHKVKHFNLKDLFDEVYATLRSKKSKFATKRLSFSVSR